jgi:trk system potassium uptake protein TrkA
MKRHIVVIGLGRFGAVVATTLYQHGHTVLGIDASREHVEQVSEAISHAVVADASDEGALRDLGIEGYDVGIVAIASNLEASVMATLLLKRFGVAHIIGKAASHLHAEILWRIGANRVIFPEREMGIQVAHTFGAPQLEDYLEVSVDYGLSRLSVPNEFVGQTIVDLDLRARFGLTVLLIRRRSEVLLHPARNERLQAGDQIVLAGRVEALEKLSAILPSAPTELPPMRDRGAHPPP